MTNEEKWRVALIALVGQETAEKVEALEDDFVEKLEAKQKAEYICADCGDEIETFILKDEVWAQVAPPASPRSLLCIFCTENRLGRPIAFADLKLCRHNRFLLWSLGVRTTFGPTRPIDGPVWKFPSTAWAPKDPSVKE